MESNHSLGESSAESFRKNRDTGETAFSGGGKENESGAAISLQVVTESGDFSVDQEYEIRKLLSPQGCTITEKDGTETDGGSLLPSAYFTLKQKKGESVEVTGGGYGHGVGMSQTAANEMAKEAYSFEEILKYFFNGITIESMV